MIYLLVGILVGFGAWYLAHVYQKVAYKRKMRAAVKEGPVPTYDTYFGCAKDNTLAPSVFPHKFAGRVHELLQEGRHRQAVLTGTYTPPSPEQLRTLDKAIESAKKNPPVYRESYAKYANDEDARRNNPSDVIAMAMIADAFISTPDTSSFSGGGGDFGGGGASGSWDSGPDTNSSSSYDSGGGSDSGSFGGSD